MDDLSRRKIRNTSDGFNGWEQWEDGGRAEDVASFRPNQLISCCCCGRTQQRWERGEEPIQAKRIHPAGGGEESTNDGREANEMMPHSSPSAELRTVNADVNTVLFNDGNLQLTQSIHQDGPKPVADTNGRRQLRVAPMPTVKRPHNSSTLLNNDIDQMLLAVLRGEGGGVDRVIAQRS
uniref:Uncharacterized protein n=1 Tax=Globodera rostochiensis TaxID=31243 RepID=A0A914HW21_GLORO